ncbi:MAG: DUF2953 domain-containing protein [Clostridia bacterium]|nr:DUF2953 domain-containing protein [Clostridia bacterium]
MLSILGWVLLSILLFVLFLLLLPIHTRVRYDGAVQVWAGMGPVSLRIYLLKKKKSKPKKEKTQGAEKTGKADKPKKKLTLEIIFDLIKLGVEALGTLKRQLVLSNLTVQLKIGDKDAAKTAILYGRVAAAVSSLYPILERNLRIKKTDIAVDADFDGGKTDLLADITLAVCPLRLLLASVVLLFHFLKIRKKIKLHNQPTEEKGGITHEQHQ